MNVTQKYNEFTPAVFVVNNTYHIMLYTDLPTLVWVQVGEEFYYDDSNGILRSDTYIHRIIVPQRKLDEEKGYTIYKRPLIERKPYFTETAGVIQCSFAFKPISGDDIRAYHISDAHNLIEPPVTAARTFGTIDFLILNGDIPDHSGSLENCLNIFKLTSQLTKGEIPVVFSRGNHDMRGVYAEKFAEYTPTDNGRSYYTFRLGSIWGMILDCGEDKVDEHEEYGNTICCHAFRERQTQFMKRVIENADNEYLADGISKRLVVVHVPFTMQFSAPFDIEDDIYSEWTGLLREYIRPDVMITGHMHTLRIDRPGSKFDYRGMPCPVVIGADVNYKDYFAGAGYIFGKDCITVTFTDSNRKIIRQETI